MSENNLYTLQNVAWSRVRTDTKMVALRRPERLWKLYARLRAAEDPVGGNMSNGSRSCARPRKKAKVAAEEFDNSPRHGPEGCSGNDDRKTTSRVQGTILSTSVANVIGTKPEREDLDVFVSLNPVFLPHTGEEVDLLGEPPHIPSLTNLDGIAELSEAPKSSLSSHDDPGTEPPSDTRHLALPLEHFAWGSQKTHLDASVSQPRYWLYWNEDMRELQIHQPPLDPDALREKRPEYSINLSRLTNGKVQEGHISEASDCHLLRFELGDVRKEGLTFKFMSNHDDMSNWNAFASLLKTLLDEQGVKAENLSVSDASKCLESALRRAAPREPTHEDKGRDSSEPLQPLVQGGDSNEAEDDIGLDEESHSPVTRGIGEDIAEALEGHQQRSQSPDATEVNERKEQHRKLPTHPNDIVLVYPQLGQGAVDIAIGDLERLSPRQFLNDTLIEYGFKSWLDGLRKSQPEVADTVHVFSSFFFEKLTNKSNKTPTDRYNSVRNWSAKVDIFDKRFVMVPINENCHWYLAIIYHPERILEQVSLRPLRRTSELQTRSRKADENEVPYLPVVNEEITNTKSPSALPSDPAQVSKHCERLKDFSGNANDAERCRGTEDDRFNIPAHKERVPFRQSNTSDDTSGTYDNQTIIFCMDSLNGNHRSALVRINEYLQEAAKDKKGVLDPHQAKIQKVMMPKQPNSYDCGLYMLHFAQCFVSNPEKYIGSIFSKNTLSDESRRKLWNADRVATMRASMLQSILFESDAWKKEQQGLEVSDSGKATSANSAIREPKTKSPGDDQVKVYDLRSGRTSPSKPVQTRVAA